MALLLATSLSASFAVVEAKPLPAAPAEWKSQVKHVAFAMILAIGLPASGDELAKGLEALKAGTLDADRDRLKKTVTLGHDALQKAVAIDQNLWTALLYESLLCRLDAELATDPAEAKRYVGKSEEFRAKATQMKESGITSTPPRDGLPLPPPPPPPKKAQAPPPPPAR